MVLVLASGREGRVVPSVLAADFGSLAREAEARYSAGADWLHVDVCGSGDQCPGALTLGPQAVAAMHAAAPLLLLDVHVATDRLGALIDALVAAGAGRIVLQWVACGGLEGARTLLTAVHNAGARAGGCLSPATAVEDVFPLVHQGLVGLVDILAVPPGFGGAAFDRTVLHKVAALRTAFPLLPFIAVDGGVSRASAAACAAAGANVLIAGAAVFGSARRATDGALPLTQGMATLLELLRENGI